MTDAPETKIDNEALNWALRFAEAGHRVFPLWGVEVDDQCAWDLQTGEEASREAGSGKRPMVTWKEWATTDQTKIEAWAEGHPECNWGVVLGEGLVVVDADSLEGEHTVEQIWDEETPELETFIVGTARGAHYYFRGDSLTYKPGTDVDVKGRGGYVVLPGSMSYNGVRYQARNTELTIGDLPHWVGQQTKPEREREVDPNRPALRYGPGNRNDGMAHIMGVLRDEGLGNDEMEQALRLLNELLCDPPLSDQELDNTIRKSMTTWPIGDRGIRGAEGEAARSEFERFFGQRGVKETDKFVTFARDRRFRPPPTWTYEHLLPSNGIAQLYGPSYSGKTFVAIDLALSLCNREPWLDWAWSGRQVENDDGELEFKDHVLYVLAEGGFDFNERIKAWMEFHGGSDDQLITIEEQDLDLSTREGWTSVIKRLAEDVEFMALRHRLGLVVLDTQSLVLASAEENSNTEMNKALREAKRISYGLDCPVLFVHHTGTMGNNGRGASATPAAMDTIMHIDNNQVLTVKKVKASTLPDESIHLGIRPVGGSAVVTKFLANPSSHHLVVSAVEYINTNGPSSFARLIEHVGITPTNTEARQRFIDLLEAAGLYNTGVLRQGSPIWDLGSYQER